MNKITEVKIERGIPTLYVDGQPFWAFAGEVHNSAAYAPDRMEAEIWMKMDQSHLNTLIVPVYWETLEPEAVSYTHLDVYKRQGLDLPWRVRHGAAGGVQHLPDPAGSEFYG